MTLSSKYFGFLALWLALAAPVALLLTDEARKAVLTAWQERKRAERRHAFLGEVAPLGLVPYLQAQLLSRHLRGDLDACPPWFWK
jgi:CRISPR-associated protein Cas1